MSKPVNPEKLAQCIKTCLEKGGIQWANAILKQHKSKRIGRSQIHEKRKVREKRLAEIIKLIACEPEKWTAGMLARKYRLSTRQIEMDLKELMERKIIVRTSGYHFRLVEDEKSPK